MAKVINVTYGEGGICKIDEMDVAKTTTGVEEGTADGQCDLLPPDDYRPISSLYMTVVSTCWPFTYNDPSRLVCRRCLRRELSR